MKKLVLFLSILYSCQLYSQTLTIKEVRGDIDSAITILSNIHPTFNQSSIKEELISLRDTLSQVLSTHDLFKILQPLVNLDGHTTLQFNGEIHPQVENPLLPFETVIFENRLYVKTNLSNDSAIIKGCEINRINGDDVTTIIENILGYVPGEKIEYKTRKLDNAGFSNWYRLVYGNSYSFDIEYNIDGENETAIVEGGHWKYFPEHRKVPLACEIIDDKIVLLKVGKFIHPKQFIPFIDSVFTEIKKRDINNLIIDKRQGGGFSMLADTLLSYISDRPYRDFEKKKIRISDETKEYIEDIEESGVHEGEYFVVSKMPQISVSRPNLYRGNVYILTGSKAYSAATMFVAMANCYTSSVIVGEETGQPLISNGDISRHKLPNSGMNLYTSHSIYYLPCAENKLDGVKPDIVVKMTLDDLLYDKDKYLDYSVDYIKKQRNSY